jgi:hypothetical protein
MACNDCTNVLGRIHQNVNTQPSQSQYVANANNALNPSLKVGETVKAGDFVFHAGADTSVVSTGNKFAGLSNTSGTATATKEVMVNFWEANDNIHFAAYFDVAEPATASLIVGNFYNFTATGNRIDSATGGTSGATKHIELLELGSDSCGTYGVFKKALA